VKAESAEPTGRSVHRRTIAVAVILGVLFGLGGFTFRYAEGLA
jgi:hypothetical protein